MELQFLGAAGTVTGSRYLVTTESARILVDCGLFQGYKQLRERNWEPLPIAPQGLDAVVLTHAHLDHSGYVPLLVRNGFRGKIHCTRSTQDLCGVLLPDSGYLQEEDAEYANRHGSSKHKPALPLYTQHDAVHSLGFFVPHGFHETFEPAPGLTVSFVPAGHILGAAIVILKTASTTLTFSGDLGRPDDLLMPSPQAVAHTDYLVVESTYGNRLHDRTDPMILLRDVIQQTTARGGVVIIPAFAVGRTQNLLYRIHLLKQSGALPRTLPIFLNSPMASHVTDIYQAHTDDHKLTRAQSQAIHKSVKIVATVEESKALNHMRTPMVIIAASGMATGGRVLHHLQTFAPDPRNTILFAGFQAGGTRGAAMLAGAESIRIFGQDIPVGAQVSQLDNLSAHADADEITAWLSHFESPPRRTFITHGEPDAADALRRRIKDRFGWPCSVPDYRDVAVLT